MEPKRPGMMPSMKGPEATFTGQVRVEMLNNPPAPARTSCLGVPPTTAGMTGAYLYTPGKSTVTKCSLANIFSNFRNRLAALKGRTM